MKILRLRFKNIHSLKGEHLIDFTQSPLYDTGIFAIIGPTGSGKTTILDVITLGLYGKISRLGNRLTNSSIIEEGAVVTRGEDEAFAEVTYQIDDTVYQSLWRFRRKKDMILLVNGQAVEDKDVDKKNEEIIGLSYDQFIRAVVLPQGEFANFLKADSDAKIQILEKITGGAIFRELGTLAFLISNDKKNLVEQKKAEINAIDLLTQEQEKEIKLNIQENINKVENIKKVLEDLEKKRQIKQDIKFLKEEIKNYQDKLSQIEDEYNQWKDKFEILQKHEKFSQYKDKIKEYSLKKRELQRLEKEIDSLIEEVVLHKKKIKDLKEVLENKTVELQKVEKEVKYYQPIIKQVRFLDTEIEKLNTIIENKSKQLSEINLRIKEKIENLEVIEKKQIELKTQLEEIDKWIEKNRILENLRMEFKSIEQGFSQYGELYRHLKQEIDTTPFKNKDKDLSLLQKDLEIFISQLYQEVKEASKSFENLLPQHLLEQKKALSQQVDLLRDLISIRQMIDEYNVDFESVIQKLKSLEDKQDQLINKKENLEKQYSDLQKKRKQIEALLDQEREKLIFQQARENLEEGKPCPVCGSVHHPYVLEGVKNYAQDYRQEINDIDNHIEEIEKSLNQVNNELSKIDGIKQEMIKRRQELSKKIDLLTNQLNEKKSLLKIDNPLSAEDLQILLQQKLTELDEVERKYDFFTQYKLKQKDLRFYQGLEKDIKSLLQQKEDLKNKINVYSDYYPQGSGVNSILKSLNNVVKEYETKEKQRNSLENTLSKIESKKLTLSDNIAEFKKNKQTVEEELKHNKRKLDEIKNERFKLLEQKDANEFWDSLVAKQQAVVEQISKIKEELGRNQVSLEEKNKHIEEKNKRTAEILSALELIEVNLLPILRELDPMLKDIDQAWNFILDDQLAAEIHSKKEDLNKKILQLNSAIKEKQQKLDSLLNKDDNSVSSEELDTLIKEYSTERDKLNQIIGQLKQKLQENENKKLNYQRLIQELEDVEQEYFRWKQLEELIGNSDGSKFQRIAQEYSFIVLLEAANSYLEKFTDRYRLEYIKEAKRKLRYDLYVVDNYMNGQRREVSTLSGGETFLVSLSLALGLSALASQRIRIQNIFIDEGFGSLDSDKLDQALAVLERFQSESRRKIGIISHVEALKERIPVKIQLIRTAKGFSKIDIVSG